MTPPPAIPSTRPHGGVAGSVERAGHGEAEDHHHHTLMQADMQRRFIGSAIVTVPPLVQSPTIQDWFNLPEVGFAGSRFVLVALATVVMAYGARP